jgi:hypothetical protein
MVLGGLLACLLAALFISQMVEGGLRTRDSGAFSSAQVRCNRSVPHQPAAYEQQRAALLPRYRMSLRTCGLGRRGWIAPTMIAPPTRTRLVSSVAPRGTAIYEARYLHTRPAFSSGSPNMPILGAVRQPKAGSSRPRQRSPRGTSHGFTGQPPPPGAVGDPMSAEALCAGRAKKHVVAELRREHRVADSQAASPPVRLESRTRNWRPRALAAEALRRSAWPTQQLSRRKLPTAKLKAPSDRALPQPSRRTRVEMRRQVCHIAPVHQGRA